MDYEIPKYPKLRYPGDAEVEWDSLFDDSGYVCVTEKLDGANLRLRWTGDEWLFGSRNVLFHDHGDPLPVDECNEQFRHAIRYVRQEASTDLDHPDLGDLDRYSLYGESMHKHSLDYDAWDGKHPDIESDVPNVVLFDAYDHENDEWLDFETVVGLSFNLELCVPNFRRVDASDVEHQVREDGEQMIPTSEFCYPDPASDDEFDQVGLAEGVVLRNTATGEKAKLVHPEFKEKNAIAFDDPAKAQTEAGTFVATYVAEPRIEKQVHKLVDEDDYDEPCMEMMQDLPRRVLTDVMAEEGWDILNNEIELTEDVKDAIRSRASKKCVRTLKSML
jgi:hypothetical protein